MPGEWMQAHLSITKWKFAADSKAMSRWWLPANTS
jgi:hypothetical protein